MNSILKALLKFCTTKNLFNHLFIVCLLIMIALGNKIFLSVYPES